MVYNERDMENLISTTELEIAELILKKMQSSNINFGLKNAEGLIIDHLDVEHVFRRSNQLYEWENV